MCDINKGYGTHANVLKYTQRSASCPSELCGLKRIKVAHRSTSCPNELTRVIVSQPKVDTPINFHSNGLSSSSSIERFK
jgi:hypothetical protein